MWRKKTTPQRIVICFKTKVKVKAVSNGRELLAKTKEKDELLTISL